MIMKKLMLMLIAILGIAVATSAQKRMIVAPEDEGFISFCDFKCSLIRIAWEKFIEAADKHHYSNKMTHKLAKNKQELADTRAVIRHAGSAGKVYFESQIWGYCGKNNDTWDYTFHYLGLFMPTKKFADVRYAIAINELAFTFSSKDLDKFFEVMKECPSHEEREKNWQTGIDFKALKKIKSIKVFTYEN